MFVGRDAIDYRRHAIAQFFATNDEGYRAWFLSFFDVDFIWLEPRTKKLPWVGRLYANESIELRRVRGEELREASSTPIETPRRIATGAAGTPYLDGGFARSERWRRERVLSPGEATMYVPRGRGEGLEISFGLEPRHGTGWLQVASRRFEVTAGTDELRFSLPAPSARGLEAIELSWHGATPVLIHSIELRALR